MEAMFPRFHLTSHTGFTAPLQALINPLTHGKAVGLLDMLFDPRLWSGVHRKLSEASHPTASLQKDLLSRTAGTDYSSPSSPLN